MIFHSPFLLNVLINNKYISLSPKLLLTQTNTFEPGSGCSLCVGIHSIVVPYAWYTMHIWEKYAVFGDFSTFYEKISHKLMYSAITTDMIYEYIAIRGFSPK